MRPSATFDPVPDPVLVDDLIDMANRLHYQASTRLDEDVSLRLHDLARQIEDIAKEVDRTASSQE